MVCDRGGRLFVDTCDFMIAPLLPPSARSSFSSLAVQRAGAKIEKYLYRNGDVPIFASRNIASM